ncbi:2-aminoethylphosphonate--pyruvate transaminase [Candidatus Marinamargulisbacteria bacterium SCGC AG-439-L15]|nr:2-aminoethylphosphonate--pyruvate transaminase [Candidatus Marinamargulisbacteria bacterium SCGC AG-439-L15]
MKTAIILAAGLGSRLKEKTIEKPKGFLTIDNTSLIERSISLLKSVGIQHIIIGTGHGADYYNNLSTHHKEIKCVLNKDYKTTGSMATLYQVKDILSDDFLLLESDLLYERKALTTAIQSIETPIMVASSLTFSGDEVYLETNNDMVLTGLSKDKSQLSSPSLEMTGINKINLKTFKSMCQFYEETHTKNPKLDYEHALLGCDQTIYVVPCEDLAWCEVDTEEHLNRALSSVYPKIKSRDLNPIVQRRILLNPGPATTSNAVKMAQVQPDICPREAEFGELCVEISKNITQLVSNKNTCETVLFGGAGTAAVEAMISSCVMPNKQLLIINNGAYGQRIIDIAKTYEQEVLEFKTPYDQAINLKELKDLIEKNKATLGGIFMVHHETTTGLLNDITSIGTLAKEHHLYFMVDAMSSYAAIPIDMDDMNIHCLAASSNKNLQGMAGVSFVIAKKTLLTNQDIFKQKSYYLNLFAQHQGFIKNKQFRFTPPVQTLYALKQALIETQLEGVDNRYNRYKKNWKTLITGLKKLQLKTLVSEKDHGKLITAVKDPDHKQYDFDKMHSHFYKLGITIYPGKLADHNTFRLANIGDIHEKDITIFLTHLENYLSSL